MKKYIMKDARHVILFILTVICGVIAIANLLAIAANLIFRWNWFASATTTLRWFGGYSILFVIFGVLLLISIKTDGDIPKN